MLVDVAVSDGGIWDGSKVLSTEIASLEDGIGTFPPIPVKKGGVTGVRTVKT